MVFNSLRRGAIAKLDIRTPSVSEAKLFIHSIAVEKEAIRAKSQMRLRTYSTVTLIGYSLQKTSKARTALEEAAHLALPANLDSS